MNSPYDFVNKAWNSTCRVLLNGEVGELDEFEAYLSRYNDQLMSRSSSISEKPVSITPMPFCKDARFISDDESDVYYGRTKQQRLNVNVIKDIDSILENIGEICYSGNIIRGNSQEVEESDCCFNSSYVYRCTDVYADKYVAFTCNIRKSEHLFGCNWGGGSSYLIKCSQVFEQTRCFEALHTVSISDCYYVANLESCANCMFSFNQKSKRNMIGNLQLTAEKYDTLKKKLIEDIRETLEAEKSVLSIEQIISGQDG